MNADLYALTTARIVEALEQGVAPWVRAWSTGVDTLPMNASSRRAYRGINVVLLELEAQARGYPLNRWLTYRQADELGGQVRRSEQGCSVVFWRLRNVAATADAYPSEDEHDLPDRVIPLLRSFTLFNVAQIDGLPPELMTVPGVAWETEARAEELLLMSGAVIRHGGGQAYYQPGLDEIHLPPRQSFPAGVRYYATALHELTHWTSHPSRCKRELGKRFGDDAYAAEELIAEIGAAFLCAHCRIDGQLEHASSYLSSWLKVLRTDKRAIFVAATKAQQAADYVLRLANPVGVNALAA
jgi:antirestriction protein ArdC